MAVKQRWDRDSWQWVYTVPPESITTANIHTAYGIQKPSCIREKYKHRRNCNNNPNCLVRLGESNWLEGFNEEEWYGIDDPQEEIRQKGSCIGLKNLGATCYINTFLQVWYHSHKIRQAVYKWIPKDKPWATMEHKDFDWSILEDKDLEPSCVCGHLQLLFALLQFSERSYIDPSSFVQSLGLDAAQQQDAQEFGKLFLSLLEEKFAQQSDPDTAVLIPRQFCGQYTYVTRCLRCGTMSKTPATFYELDLSIKMHKTLDSCIMEFLKEERLEKSNQYHCDQCRQKCDAVRQIQINRVPPILNIQLLRFVYCMQTGNKQKLNTFISFPEVLDLTQYVHPDGCDEQELVYELKAVLIHRGPSANSGHYVAHIFDQAAGNWYKFNDEEVQQIKGKTLKLGLEEDPLDPSKGKKTKAAKGSHSSKNAYMLVYHQREPKENNCLVEPAWESLPGYLQELVKRDNKRLHEWIEELIQMRKGNVQKGRARHDEILDIFSTLPAKKVTMDGELVTGSRLTFWQPHFLLENCRVRSTVNRGGFLHNGVLCKAIHDLTYDFIETSWIKEWLDPRAKVTEIPQVNNKDLLCTHGKVDPGKIHLLKRIKKEAANKIYGIYGGGPRISETGLCEACVKARATLMRLQSCLQEDSKYITQGLKSKVEIGSGYWVGKNSLKCWKRLAQSQVEETEGNNTEVNGNSKGDDSTPQEEEMDSELVQFNEDIQCPHGSLSTDTSNRRIISVGVWTRLKKYFTSAPEFAETCQLCALCQRSDDQKAEEKDLNCAKAASLKDSLSNIYITRRRPSVGSKDWSELKVVSQSFISELQAFMRHPTSSPLPSRIDNTGLMCEHGGLVVQPWNQDDPNRSSFFLVWHCEWEILEEMFPVNYTIRLFQTKDESVPRYQTQPEVCEKCYHAISESLKSVKYEYSGAKLYIRKLTQDDVEAEFLRDARQDADPDYAEHVIKKPKLAENLVNTDGQRRSSRHRRVRGEKEVIASSTNTLKELKIKVMHAFSVPPFDQTLLLNGRVLSPDEATLSSLEVEPESVISLKVDQNVSEEALNLQNILRTDNSNHAPESGFKGTGLLSDS